MRPKIIRSSFAPKLRSKARKVSFDRRHMLEAHTQFSPNRRPSASYFTRHVDEIIDVLRRHLERIAVETEQVGRSGRLVHIVEFNMVSISNFFLFEALPFDF